MSLTIDYPTDAPAPLQLYLSAGRNHANTLQTIRLEFTADRANQRRASLHHHHGAAPPRPLEAQPRSRNRTRRS
jgi:hypothetical protein